MARRTNNQLGFSEIAQRFREAYNGHKNIMTPKVLRYGKRGKYLFELSEGPAILDPKGKIYGVTVITTKAQKCHDLSKCFMNYGQALAYARSLPYEKEPFPQRRDARGFFMGEEE